MLNEINPRRILAACPHCLHTLLNEYPAFGGHYEVIHHTQLINELLVAGRLQLEPGEMDSLTFHDPCYLGRQNNILIEPRSILNQVGGTYHELPRSQAQSFCCGAGGAQMWKEEEEGQERVSSNRLQEAEGTGAKTLAVGCPFCMVMLTDAQKAADSQLEIQDVAEIVADRIVVDSKDEE